jgi:cytochrome c-type biogenesis protein CcmH
MREQKIRRETGLPLQVLRAWSLCTRRVLIFSVPPFLCGEIIRMKRFLVVLLLVCAAPSMAGEAPPVAQDPVIEARLMKLAAELRCLVCQNQSLADSHAGLALDLKEQVREQMKAGKSDDEIRAYMVARYGDFVLYSPPVKPVTWLLWGGPFVLLLAGGAGLAFYMRSRRRKISRPDMSPEDQARARALLDGQSRKE